MIVTIPAKTDAAAHRNPKYISASTQSMVIYQVSGTTKTQLASANLSPTSQGCSVTSSGTTQCTVSFLTTAGSDVFQMNMYDQANGAGNLLSTGETPVETIVAGQANTVDVTLDGVPASLSVVLGQGTLPVGTASTTSVTVVAEDADDNVIVGPGGFSGPIALAITGDTYKTLSITYGTGQSSITSPGQTVTLNYSGGTNVGSTITASTTGATSGSAPFAGSGAAITIIPFSLTIPSLENFYGYPVAIAAYADGSGAAAVDQFSGYTSNPCCTWIYANAIDTVTVTGTRQYFVGSGSAYAGYSGITAVSGMSSNVFTEGWEADDEIAVDSSKNVYYSAENSSNCYVIGKLNPTGPTATETVLQGEAMYIHVDSNGNVWFLEENGTCSSSNGSGFASGWGVGELTSGGTLTERDLGITGITPGDMAITPDGSTMFIADYYSGGVSDASAISKVNTSTLSATSINLTNSLYPEAIAADPSGNAAWFSDNDPGNNYYYGTTTSSFATAAEAPFPVSDFDGYGMVYADGSFWVGNDNGGDFGRISNVTSGTPVTNYYAIPPTGNDYQELCDVSAANGTVFGADCDLGNIDLLQYGAPNAGATATISSVHRLGQQTEPKNKRLLTHTRKARPSV